MKIYYKKQAKLIRERTGIAKVVLGDEYEYEFIEVKLLGVSVHEGETQKWETYLIELPDGIRTEVVRSEVFLPGEIK